MNSWKLEHVDFVNILNCSDILVLIETWKTNEKRKITDANSGYMEFNVCRPSVKSARRGSGGITVLLRKQLSDYLCFVKSHENGIVWFKVIQQSYDQCDIYLCYIYIPPKDSFRNVVTDEDLFDLLYTDVIKYNAIGKVIIYGDMNARCGNLSDYIDYNFNDRDDLDDILFTREEHDVKQRTSEDKKINHYGKRLIDLCIANNLLIVNGRSVSDPTGSCTCYTYNGSSVVDYMLCNKDLIDCIDLKVDDINSLSDHCMLRTFLSVSTFFEAEQK